MKICSTCKQKYSDSLEYCMQDGTVLSALPDPNATLRLENRPTNAETAPKKRPVTSIIIAIACVLLLALIVVVGAVVVYVMSPNRTGAAANPSTSPSTGLSENQRSNEARPTKDEISRTIEQMNDEIGTALVHSDIETLDRLLAEDYHYENDQGLRLTKQQFLSLLRTGSLHYDFVTSTNAKVDVDNNLARVLLTAQAQFKGQLQGSPFNSRFTYTNTYEKRSSGWQLVSERAWYR